MIPQRAHSLGAADRPVVLGLLAPHGAQSRAGVRIAPDGASLVLEAEREIQLCCGKASVTLRADGKVIVRGSDLLSRASGANRIKGATVRLN